MKTADEFMWALAEELLDARLTQNAEFQEFCLNVWDRLTVKEAAEEWERRS